MTEENLVDEMIQELNKPQYSHSYKPTQFWASTSFLYSLARLSGEVDGVTIEEYFLQLMESPYTTYQGDGCFIVFSDIREGQVSSL